MKGYFSTAESPLEMYLCRSGCPGGAPGVCDGGLVGLTCGECPNNFYKSSGDAWLTGFDQFLNDLQVSREKPVSIYPSLTCTASSLLEKNAEECRPCGSTPLAQLFWIAPVIFVVGTSLGRSWPAQRQAFQHWH